MKKTRLFILSLLGISAISCGVGLSCIKSQAPTFAYAESEPVDEETTEPTEPTEPTDEEEPVEPIDIDEETSKLSQVAKDTIAVIKEFFSQPLVIGGVSTTLGAVVLFVFAKLLGHALDKRDTKYDKKIKDLLEKIGVSDDIITELQKEYDKLYDVVQQIIANTKNVKVKQHLEELLAETKASVSEIEEKVIEETDKVVSVAEESKTDTETEIKSILES